MNFVGMKLEYNMEQLEEGCQLTTADEIADSVNQLLGRIQEEAAST